MKTLFLMSVALTLTLKAGVCSAVTVAGYVNQSCGKWIEESKKQQLDIPKAALEASVLAYLSGYASGADKDFLVGTDWASMHLWIDNYCMANPLDKVWKAADQLANELMRRKGTR